MPSPVTSYTTSQPISGAPLLTHSFDHDGTDVEYFQFLRRDYGSSDAWESIALIPAADIFDSGTSYEATLPTPENSVWKVRAVSATGVVST